MNNPLKYLDKDGLRITVSVHEVLFGNYHTSITIALDTPELIKEFGNDPLFQNTDDDGNQYATLGAGPEGGKLVGNPNREKDLYRYNKKEEVKTDLNGQNEKDVVKNLFEQDKNYKDNLKYDLFPKNNKKSKGYNSNSYTKGMLNAAKIKSKDPKKKVPGWNKPVPPNNFDNDPTNDTPEN